MPRAKSYYGKYRGSVVNVMDPMRLGRIQALVPDVLGNRISGWALPCFPVSGMFLLPQNNDAVWIEFEKGDPGAPIWSGVYYGNASALPALAQGLLPQTPAIVMQILSFGLRIGITAGGRPQVELASTDGARISLSEGQVEIDDGRGAIIRLAGPEVDVNNGALTVT